MLRNRRLARRVAGVGMAELRRQIEYTTGWAGSTVHRADRWFPSSKTCSGCGVVKTKLRLSERMFRCDQCPLVLDRDRGAARNLAQLVDEVAAARPPRVAWATVNEPDGTHTRTAPRGQRVPPREGPRGQRRAARRRLPEQMDSRSLTLQVTDENPQVNPALRSCSTGSFGGAVTQRLQAPDVPGGLAERLVEVVPVGRHRETWISQSTKHPL